MGRPLRILTHSTLVHVWNRGADRQDIFVDDSEKAAFVELLAEHVTANDVVVHAYALMTNHFHLLLESPDSCAGPISSALHDIETPFARSHNRAHRRTGPLFENRFGMKEITTAVQLDRVGRYIHRNPLALGLGTPLVEYRHSSLPVYAGRLRRPDWLTTDRIGALHGRSPADYLTFVERLVPGDEVFAGWPWGIPDVDELLAAVADVLGCDAGVVREKAPGWDHARLLAVTLAVELRLLRSDELAQFFGYDAPASARSAARRGRVRLESDPRFAAARSATLRQIGRPRAA